MQMGSREMGNIAKRISLLKSKKKEKAKNGIAKGCGKVLSKKRQKTKPTNICKKKKNNG
jgi:hypothetical protein